MSTDEMINLLDEWLEYYEGNDSDPRIEFLQHGLAILDDDKESYPPAKTKSSGASRQIYPPGRGSCRSWDWQLGNRKGRFGIAGGPQDSMFRLVERWN